MRGLAAVVAAVAGLHIHVVGPAWAVAVNDRGDILGPSFVVREGRLRALKGVAVAMNAGGDVVGYFGHSAILWRADGSRLSLGTGIPAAINDNSWVVGTDGDHGFVWHDGARVDLGAGTAARAINDRNQVVGTHGSHAFLRQNGRLTDLPAFRGERSEAVRINDLGWVLGDSRPDPAADPDHVWVWRNGSVRSLGAFGGARSLTPVDLNDRGDVLVDSEFPDHHAWLWRDGKARDLGTVGHPWWNVAYDINGRGDVVGNVQRAPHGPSVPYVWRNGRFTILPSLDGVGPPTSSANHINDHGVVVGTSYSRNGTHAVVWR